MKTHQLKRADGKIFKVKILTPQTPPLGLVVVSPGAGGSENGYGYLVDYFATHGWLVCAMEHLESNLDSLREHTKHQGLKKALVEMVTDPLSYQGRIMEIQGVLDWIGDSVGGPRILVGHSMGAATVMIEAGAKNKLGCHGKDRFSAYIALSPQGPGLIFLEGAWEHLSKPMLLITGTEDHELDSAWGSRLKSFEGMKSGTHKWLGVIDGATHMNLAGVGLSRKPEQCVIELVDLFIKKNMGQIQGDLTTSPGITLVVK